MKSLKRFIFNRAWQALIVIFFVITLNFLIINLAPGNIAYVLGGEGAADPEYYKMIERTFGLDKPLLERYFIYLDRVVLHADLGNSYWYREPVIDLILQRVPNTLLLAGIGLTIASILGVLLGVFAAARPFSIWDAATTGFSLVGYAIPGFWLAQIILLIFALQLGWFPSGGMTSLPPPKGLALFADFSYHLVLPAFALSFHYLALITRLTRSTMMEALRQDYIVTARSKGLTERVVLLKHALKNAFLPVLTVIAMNFGFMLAGATVTETIFGWPGVGTMIYDAITHRDHPLLIASFLVLAITVVTANLIADILYSYLDPRIRYR